GNAACRGEPTDVSKSARRVSRPAGVPPCQSVGSKPSSATAACVRVPMRPRPRAPFTVSLTASPTALAPGGTTSLTATTNQDVGPTPWFIEIFDQTTGTFLADCGFGTSCQTSVTHSASTIRTYVAYVSGFGTGFPPP